MKKLFIFLVPLVILLVAFFGTRYYLEENRYNFTAQSMNGEVNLHSFDGENKLIYFGYTYCPDICPTTLNDLGQALKELNIKDTTILFITLDPNRDSVKRADEFVKFFYPNSHGLVVKDLNGTAKRYGVRYEIVPLKDSAMKYSIAHSGFVYLFNKNGKYIGDITNLTYENIISSLKKLENSN